jgi:hypothetical protein
VGCSKNEDVKIGAILVLTTDKGTPLPVMEQFLDGMQFAVETINKNGGVNGKEIRLTYQLFDGTSCGLPMGMSGGGFGPDFAGAGYLGQVMKFWGQLIHRLALRHALGTQKPTMCSLQAHTMSLV